MTLPNMNDNFNMDFLDDYPSLENMSFALTDSQNDNKEINDNNNNKVEVRWLESEANLYLKYWRMGYRLLDDPYNEYSSKSWKKKQILDEYDRWYLTAKNILDIDLDFIRPKDYEKLNKIYNPSSAFPENPTTNNTTISSSSSSDVFFEDSIDNYELEANILQYSCFDFDENLDFMAAIKTTNFIVKNGKIEFPTNSSTKKRKPSEKPRKKPNKIPKMSPSQQSISTTNIETQPPIIVPSPSVSHTSDSPDRTVVLVSGIVGPETPMNKSPKKVICNNHNNNNNNNTTIIINNNNNTSINNNNNISSNSNSSSNNSNSIKRPKVASNRRQMFICEFPGCNYQSDRNFNFLRHKRTHGKPKGDPRKTNLTPRYTHEGDESFTLGTPLKQANEIIANPSTITLNERMNLEENEQNIAYESDEYIERQDIIMRDLNLNHVLGGDSHKHTFAQIAIQQPFLS